MPKLAMVGTVLATAVAAGGALADGKSVWEATCSTCHLYGVSGAPKMGDREAWKDRIAQGNDKLYEHALKGFQGKAGTMPAKGGFPNLSDAEVKSAVDYMVGQSK